jgi:hypothetical protein
LYLGGRVAFAAVTQGTRTLIRSRGDADPPHFC